MLGWNMGVHRFADPELREHRGDLGSIRALIAARGAASELPRATGEDLRLAVWQAGLGGIYWLDQLVDAGKAAHTLRGGFPESYLIRCSDFRSRLRAGLPNELSHEPPESERWPGRTTVDARQVEDCDAEEWLLVEAWGEPGSTPLGATSVGGAGA